MRRKIAIFDVLAVCPEDDISKIRLAWRKKVKELHPDIVGNDEASGEFLARVNAAFDSLKTHKPFAERRRGDRRRTWRSGRVWSRAERSRKLSVEERTRLAQQARQQAEADAAKRRDATEKARRRAQAEAIARKNAADLEQREAAALAAVRRRRAQAKRPVSKQEQEIRLVAMTGYANARQATSM